MPRLREPIKTLKKEELFEAPPPETPEDKKVEAGATDTAVKAEPKPAPKKEPEQDEASLALQKQLEKIRESEALVAQYQRERDEAIRRAREQEVALAKQQRQAVESRYDSVAIALKAAKEKLEFAEKDLRSAKANGDLDAEIEATKRMTQANAEILTLEPGRDELREERKKEKKKYREIRNQAQQQPQPQRPDTAPHVVAWARAHPEYFDNGRMQAKMNSAYFLAEHEGYVPYSVEMLERMNEILGHTTPKEEPESQKPNRIVSAPVSREAPSGGAPRKGQQTLTAEEREFARISGITEAEYAKQKMKLQELKATGDERYGGQR